LNSFEKLTNDLLQTNKNKSSSKSNYTVKTIFNNLDINNNKNYLNSNCFDIINNQNIQSPNSITNNINDINYGNKGPSYNNIVFQQQENRIAKMKKDQIIRLLENKPSNEMKNSTERNANNNLYGTNVYLNQSKISNGILENNKNFNSILNENPDIKKRVANGNMNKNGLNSNGNYIENFGLVPNSNNTSINIMNNTTQNAGREFTEFINSNKNKNKDFHYNFMNSPLKNNYSNHTASRNSLKNLNAVKSRLENLFDKPIKNDKNYNNAMDNLCAFLNYKNRKNSGNSLQQTDKSAKLMEEINHIRLKSYKFIYLILGKNYFKK